MGIREDTHLVGQQYSWLTTIFYLVRITILCLLLPLTSSLITLSFRPPSSWNGR